MKNYAAFVDKFRFIIIAFTLLLTFLMANGAKLLFNNTDNDYRTYFNDDNPELLAFDFIQNSYTKSDNALIVISPKTGDVFNPNSLAAIQWLTQQAWQLTHSTRVDSIANYQHTETDGDNLTVAELYEETAGLTPAQLERIKNIVLNEELLLRRLIAENSETAGINVTFTLPDDADQTIEFKTIANELFTMRSEFRKQFPEHDIYLTGIVMMNQAFADASISDAENLLPITYLIVLIILIIMLRSTIPVLSIMLLIIFSIIWAYGFAGYVGMKLTTPMYSVMNIVMTLAIADGVHLFMTLVQGMRNGQDKASAMTESLITNAWPIFLTSVTTAIGFLTLNFSDAPPFVELGNTSAFGVMAAWFLSMTFLPAMVYALPVNIKPKDSRSSLLMSKFADFVIIKRHLILFIFIPLSLMILYGASQNDLNDDFVKYFDEKIEFRTDTDIAYKKLTGINNIQYSLPAKESNGITDPEYLKVLEQFVEWHREQENVLNVDSINDVFKRLNKNMHGDDPNSYKIPESKELAAQYLLLYELSLPYGLDLNNQIDVDKSASRIIITTENVTNNEVMAIANDGQQWLKDNAPDFMQSIGASPTVMFANVAERNINTMLFGTLIALVLISGILIFALKSLKIGLLSLVPNLLPIGLAFGFWGYAIGQIGLASSIVAAICMGIVVDDTVHFLSKYLRARRVKGLSPEDAIRYAFSTVGIALWVTSLVLVLGFLVLASSSFLLNAQLGQLVFLTISLALITDFLLLPPLLMWLDKEKA